MNAERLLALYDRVTDAPDAVGRLRRFVLGLAVRGKLVEQDPGDEPVSELLRRIAVGKARMVEVGEIRKPRKLSNGEGLVPPFEIPATWRWCRLDVVGAIVGGGTPRAGDPRNFSKPGEGVAWLTPRDLGGHRSPYIERGSRDLSERGLRSSSATLMPPGTVLFSSRAPIGYVAIASNPISTNQGFKSVVPYVSGCSKYIALAMRTFAPEIEATAPGTTFKEASGKIVAGVPFPLPPLAEQHRIVAKVDELMVLCDRMEETRAAREDTRDRLTKAGLTRLTAPETDTVAFRSHARFAIHALPALTARPDQVKQLRQTVLNLAVRGKLVEQDSTEEPASELLERTEELPVPARYAKRSPELIPGDCGLSINRPRLPTPSGWSWVPLVRVARLESGHTPSRSRADWWGGDVPWMGLADARTHNNGRIFDTTQYTNQAGLANSAARLLPEGTVCFSRTASVGYVVIMGRPMATSQDFVNWVPTKAVASEWLQLVMMAERPALHRFSKGAVHQTIYYPAWLAMHVVLPPLAEQQRIVARVEELVALCGQLEAGVGAADVIRSSLLDSVLHESLVSCEATINGDVRALRGSARSSCSGAPQDASLR